MKALQTWTPRVRRLIYDALQQDIGCQVIVGATIFASRGFEQVCTFEHDPASSIFTASDKISYADGPLNTGNLPPWATRWAAWVASRGIRVAKLPSINLPADTVGVPSSLFDGLTPLPAKVTLGFTPQGLLGIAIQRDGATIQVKWFRDSEGVYGDASFPGVSPVLFGNARLFSSNQAGQGDLVLYYLSPAVPKAIFARFQREDFLVEHIVNADLPNPLSRLLSTEAVGDRQKLYALDSIGRDVTLTSPEYVTSVTGDKGSLFLGVARGAYEASAVPVSITAGSKSQLTIAVESGAYSDVIVKPTDALSGDQASLTISIESGSYE